MLFVPLHPERVIVDGCIVADAGRRGIVVVAIEPILHSFVRVRRSDFSIVCPPSLAVYCVLFVKETRLKFSSFHMWNSAVSITLTPRLSFVSLDRTGVPIPTSSIVVVSLSRAASSLDGTMWRCMLFVRLTALATT